MLSKLLNLKSYLFLSITCFFLATCKPNEHSKEDNSKYAFANERSSIYAKVEDEVPMQEEIVKKKVIRMPTIRYFSREKIKYSFCDRNAPDTIVLQKINNEYVELLLDSLSNERSISDLEIYDFNNDDLVLFVNFHIGSIEVDKRDDNTYHVTSFSMLPIKGDWDGKWKSHTLIEYDVEISEHLIKIYQTSPDFTITLDSIRLKSIIQYVSSNESCNPIDRYIPDECAKDIEIFEYNLFVAILNGKTEYIPEYLVLLSKYKNSFSGQFAEYLTGNYMTLLMLKKIDITEKLIEDIPHYIVME